MSTHDRDENPLVSYVLATYNRPEDLEEAIDSVLDQDYRPLEVLVISNSNDETARSFEQDLFENGDRFDDDRARYYHFPERMGVPKARNVGYEHAAGEIFVTIDDDAVLASSDATDEIVSLFERHEDVGVLAFQHRNYYTGDVQLDGTPDPPEFQLSPTQQYRTGNFIGVGNAIRRRALEAAGAYPDDFTYGFEEMDLSLRVHDTGYDILYTPSILVRHKESPEGRRPGLEVRERLVENRIRIAVRNLPWRYVLFTALIWSVYGLVITRDPSSVSRMLKRLYKDRNSLLSERNVIDRRTIARLKSRRTMLFFWWFGPDPRRILGPSGNLERLFWGL